MAIDLNFLNRWIDPFRRRVLLMIGKALIQAVDNSGKIQVCKVSLLKDELKDSVENIAHYGFYSIAPKDSEAVVISIGGNRDNMLIIGTENSENRPTTDRDGNPLVQNDVVIWNKNGDKIILREGNIVEIITKTLKINADTKVEIISPEITTTGKIGADGNIESAAKVKAAGNVEGVDFKNAVGLGFTTHIHPTTPPGPVTPPQGP